MAVDLSVPYRHATHVSGGTRGVQMMRSREDSVNRNGTTSDSSGLYIAVLHSPFSFAAENNETIRSRSELTIIHGGGDWTAHENIASSAICVTRVVPRASPPQIDRGDQFEFSRRVQAANRIGGR